jgi:hypothetical protein
VNIAGGVYVISWIGDSAMSGASDFKVNAGWNLPEIIQQMRISDAVT